MADLIANSHGNESIVISITTGSFLLSKAVCTEEIDRHAARAARDQATAFCLSLSRVRLTSVLLSSHW